jgi:uncharacterized protein
MRMITAAATFAATFAIAGTAHTQPLGLSTSPQGTATYAIGAAVAKVLTEKGNIQARVQPSSGTGAALALVNSGEVDVGFSNTLELLEAYQGTGIFDKRPNPKLRTLAILFPFRVGFFVRNDSPIQSVKDMKGKTLAYGFTSQEVLRVIADAMLASGGLTPADVKTVLVPNLVRGVDEFIAGRVDVTLFAPGAGKVAEADAAVGGIRYIPLDDSPAAVAAMRKLFPTSYMSTVNPAPSLAGIRNPVKLMHFDYTMMANADLPPARVKTVVQILADNKEALSQTLPLFRDFNPQRMYHKVNVPYHPGALDFYRERGIKESE